MCALHTRVVLLLKTLLELSGEEGAGVAITQLYPTLLCHHQVVFSLNSCSSQCILLEGAPPPHGLKVCTGQCQELWILTLVLLLSFHDLPG